MQSEPIRLKYCFLGDAFSGKSSLVHRIVHNEFKEKLPTVGCSFESISLSHDNKPFKIYIWDTAGQERYAELVPIYYRNNDVFILCFDLSREDGINSIAHWLERIHKWSLNSNSIICLVGTKCDIKVIPSDKLRSLYDKFSFFYCETSSKDNIGIPELLDWTLSNAIYSKTYNPSPTTPPTNKTYFCSIL